MFVRIQRFFKRWLINRLKSRRFFIRDLCATSEFILTVTANPTVCKRMLDDLCATPEFVQAIIANPVLCKRMLNDLCAIPDFQQLVSQDASLLKKLLHMSDEPNSVLDDLLLERLKDSRTIQALIASYSVQASFFKEILRYEEMKKMAAADTEVVEKVHQALFDSALWNESQAFLRKILADKRTLEYIIRQPDMLLQILTDDRAIAKTVNLQPVRAKLQIMRAREIAAKIPYSLPAVVLSYPRAGSNFLQSVLQGSCGLRCQSIYGQLDEGPQCTLTVKSHSPSPEYFCDEWRRLMPGQELPQKIIRLQRDPRDLFISFFEYTEANRKTTVRQEEFLEHVDFFYASTIDRLFLRAVNKQGLTVLDAFKTHVRTWYCEPCPSEFEMLPVRYEELITAPQETFLRIFNFLHLDCGLEEKFLRFKVAQYSDTGRPRAVAQGWVKNRERYAILLDKIEALLADEIRLLGYSQ